MAIMRLKTHEKNGLKSPDTKINGATGPEKILQ